MAGLRRERRGLSSRLWVAVALLGQAGRLPLANVQLAGGLGFASNADTFGWTRAVRRHQIPVLGLGAALTLFGAATRSRISAFFRFAGRAAGLSEPLIPASLTLIALSTLAVRQSVTPRLNARRDAGLAGDDAGARRFAVGQRISDLINIAQFLIVLAVIVSILSDLG